MDLALAIASAQSTAWSIYSFLLAHPLITFSALYFILSRYFTNRPAAPRADSRIKHPVGAAAYAAEMRAASPKELVVVDYYATWCGPCVAIAPFIEELADKHVHTRFVKVQEDQSRDVIKAEGIRAFPTFRFFLNSRCVGELVGADRRRLADEITRLAVAAQRGEVLAELPRPAAGEGGEGGCQVA